MSATFAQVLVALTAVLVVGRLLSLACAWLRQPPVIGEVVAGILLGPSLLGQEMSARILPAEVGPYLGVLAQFGIVLYMFLVGLELDIGFLRARAATTFAVSLASIAFPFGLGGLLALWLYPSLAAGNIDFTSFALFLAVAMSITAFPVLARILADRGLTRTELGVLALGCAAINDAVAWCLLAFVVGVVQAKAESALPIALLAAGFMLFVILAARPAASWLARRCEVKGVTPAALAWVFVAVLLAALTTEWIGIHAIFGAFLLGAVVPHDCRLTHEIDRKTHDVVTMLLLPAFFAYTGMRTQIGLVSGVEQWLVCGALIAAATVGKVGGAAVAARCTGVDWHMAGSLGVLLNTRGLMELIVLNIGLELGVLSPTLFAMMVLMALGTTLATAPLLDVLNFSSAKR